VGYHLSVVNIAVGINLPTLYRIHLAVKFGRAALTDSLCGISACKVYPRIMLPLQAVSSYLTFSPLSRHYCRDSYFLWHFLFPVLPGSPVLPGALLCAVRTFLLSRQDGKRDSLACSNGKNTD